jgi:DNA-binding response OmpR family regulator
MDIRCPRCGSAADAVGHEDARAFFECRVCGRVWTIALASLARLPSERWTPRVLVVDDSLEMVQLLAAWLEEEGCDVSTALTGRQALDAAAEFYPDIVFLDVVLPPPDGFQVCQALKHQLAPEVILMTGISNPLTARRGADLGVVALLQKPFTRETAMAAYATAVERCRRDPLAGLRQHFGLMR